ncbi:MAG: IclR family transcriptional regulator [Nakamurella sp.]
MSNAVDIRQSMYPLRAVDRVCDIIDLLAEHPAGITLSNLASALALPKSSAFRYLAALEVRHYVDRTEDGISYRLGAPAVGTGGGQPESSRLDRMIAVANPLMGRLTTVDAPVCVLATLDGYGIRYLAVSALDPGDVRVPRVDDRSMLHLTAAGKAVAAQLTDEAVLRMVNAAGMPQATSASLGSPTALLRELHRIRGEGFAMSDTERHAQVRGIAVPIGGQTLALSVAGRSEQLSGDRVASAIRQLRRAAVVLARELRG